MGAKAKGRFLAAVKDGVVNEAEAVAKLTKDDYIALAKQMWVSIRDAVLKKLAEEQSIVPDPRVVVLLEVGHLSRSAAWQLRVHAGYGISKVTLGPVLAGHIGDPSSFAVGFEATVNVLWGQGPRPWHVQGFGRYEWYFFDHAAFGDHGAAGLRLILDVL